MVPGLSKICTPAKLTRSIEEAKVIAADYSLVQLGYPMEGSSLAILLIQYLAISIIDACMSVWGACQVGSMYSV